MKFRLLIIVVLFVLITCFSKVTYSLFTSETSIIFGNMDIAEFIFETKRVDHIELGFSDIKPGDINEYYFEVTNTKDNIITSVTTEYQITIKTFHFMPLLIELYKDDEKVMTCNDDYSRNENNALVCNSDIWEMEHSSTAMEKFMLKVSFPEEYNSYDYAELVDFIDMDISSWQKLE